VEVPGRTQVGVYRRDVGAELPRVLENVRDWEHLPWLHASAFSRVERLASGRWGWRARVGLAPAAPGREILLELKLEPGDARYVARTLEGPGAGTEIWTRLAPAGARTRVEVEFHVPGVPVERAADAGRAFERLYARLWDEDESMIVRRTRELARRAEPAPGPTALGPLAALRARLPLLVELGGLRYRLLEEGGELVAHAAACPHRLGPLEEAAVEGGRLRCPWHGWRFDLRSGRACDGRRARLAPAPRIEVDGEGGVTLWPPARGRRPAAGPPA
jgi:nitrite reductase/ring-hydroxylating ferredoxin subunit